MGLSGKAFWGGGLSTWVHLQRWNKLDRQNYVGKSSYAGCQVPAKAGRCDRPWGSGNNEKVNTSKAAMVIPLFFFFSIF